MTVRVMSIMNDTHLYMLCIVELSCVALAQRDLV